MAFRWAIGAEKRPHLRCKLRTSAVMTLPRRAAAPEFRRSGAAGTHLAYACSNASSARSVLCLAIPRPCPPRQHHR